MLGQRGAASGYAGLCSAHEDIRDARDTESLSLNGNRFWASDASNRCPLRDVRPMLDRFHIPRRASGDAATRQKGGSQRLGFAGP